MKTKATSNRHIPVSRLYNKWLIFSLFGLIAFGLVMVASASIVISEKQYHYPFHYLIRQLIYLMMGLSLAAIILRIPTKIWERLGGVLLLISIVLLTAVLIPGIGREVNGSMRWIGIGPIGLQISEFAKFGVLIYMAGYLVRRQEEVQTEVLGFIKPMLVLGVIAVLLLKEPDFGATVVITLTVLGLLFLAGVKIRHFIILVTLVAAGMAVLAISSPYRLQRLTTFLNPWAVQYESGYQLTQSLIAFGRGGVFGVGLGDSVQKLFYLPEAHTDFLFAVLAEELGLVGILIVISLYIIMISQMIAIGRQAQLNDRLFGAYVAYGAGFWLGLQAMINMGVNAGVLPTKGLTLPLMSYGGSSMLIDCMIIALVLRIDYEQRMESLGFKTN